jgi:hypothetical protein
MSITTLDGYIGSSKQILSQRKTTSMTSVNNMIFSPFALGGTPGAGTLAGTNATVGVVPTDSTAGCPVINFSTGSGYITRANGYNSVAGTIMLCDMLLKLGTFAYNANSTGLTTEDISGRIPGGTDYTGCQIWLEQVTAMTGNQTIAIGYKDGADQAQTTGTIATGVAPIVGRCFVMPMANGTGVRGITSVVSTVSSAGTFNVLIVRPLIRMRIPFVGYSEQRDLYGTGMPQIFPTSALTIYSQADSTASGLPEFEIEIANG